MPCLVYFFGFFFSFFFFSSSSTPPLLVITSYDHHLVAGADHIPVSGAQLAAFACVPANADARLLVLSDAVDSLMVPLVTNGSAFESRGGALELNFATECFFVTGSHCNGSGTDGCEGHLVSVIDA